MGTRRGQKSPHPSPGNMADPHGMARAVADFAEAQAIAGYSERTVDLRVKALYLLIEWLEERAITRPSEVTKPILERYQRSLYHRRKADGAPLSFRFQHSLLTAVRLFFRWLARHNRILYNPASELELPRVEKRLPKHVLTASEAELVIAQPDTQTLIGVRDRAILEAFYSTGIRRMEAVHLKLYDLDVERGTLMVRQGKGKKDRMIPIGDRAVAWVEKYLNEVRPMLVREPDEGWIFLTKEGEYISPDHMTGLVGTYVESAGIGKRGSCHLFRHAMATLMLEGGADIRFIQQMLGHAEISTTEVYTRVSIKLLKQVHTATHPGATLARHRSPGADDLEESGTGPYQPALFSLAAEGIQPSKDPLQAPVKLSHEAHDLLCELAVEGDGDQEAQEQGPESQTA